MKQLDRTRESQEHSRRRSMPLYKVKVEMLLRLCLVTKWWLVINTSKILRISHHRPWSLTNNSLGVKPWKRNKTLLIKANQWWMQAASSQDHRLIMTNFKIKSWMHPHSLDLILLEVMNKCAWQSYMLPGKTVPWANNLPHKSFQAMKRCANRRTGNLLSKLRLCTNH